jgi:hydrogenase expression/formation protein HypE
MKNKEDQITMLHGAGGTVMHDLVKNCIVKYLGGIAKVEVPLEAMDDAAVVENIVFKSDSHAVKPIFFPGGDIGRLSISGTVNDISMLGAQPIALASGFILEEGLALRSLERILASMKSTCIESGVGIVTGDTKVVEKGALGGCVMNVSGMGKRTPSLEHNLEIVKKHRSNFKARWTLDSNLQVGDKIILSGTIGDHGIAVLSAQEGLTFGSEICSDVKPLNKLIQHFMSEIGGVVSMKDPTRGGLADCLHEFAEKSKTGILMEENKIPVRKDVRAACEMLGLDPLEIGNEGKVVIGVIPQKAQELLNFLKGTEEGKNAEIIGEVTASFGGVAMQTVVGGKRIIARPVGDPVPRIC